MNRDYSYLISSLNFWNFNITDEQIKKLDTFYDLLIEKNKVMNLTAITDFDDVLVKHFLDSLALVQLIKDETNLNVIDLGTGAGFPGIPLAIVFPEFNFTLIDSLNKRILFLEDVVSTLNLKNVILVHARAEEAGRNKLYREKFDLCVSRAVANIATLSEYCLPFVKVNGKFISYKSADVSEEVFNSGSAISKLGGKLIDPFYFDLPNSDIRRSFLIVNKIKNTSSKYPRKPGTPSKEPLN